MSKSVKVLTTALNAAASASLLAQTASEMISTVSNGKVTVSVHSLEEINKTTTIPSEAGATSQAANNNNNNNNNHSNNDNDKVNNHSNLNVTIMENENSKMLLVGTEPPPNVYAGIVQPSPTYLLHAGPYANIRTAVIRAILPRSHTTPLPLRDILDVYHKAGINCSNDEAIAQRSFAKAAQVAIATAQQRQANRISLVIKPASKYERLNNFFTQVCGKAIEDAGLSVDVLHTAQAANDLIMFPEKHSIFLVNDEPTCARVQFAYAGLIGGNSIQYVGAESDAADTNNIYGGHSYTSVAYAVANTLRELGLVSEATKVEEAASKVQDYKQIASSLERVALCPQQEEYEERKEQLSELCKNALK